MSSHVLVDEADQTANFFNHFKNHEHLKNYSYQNIKLKQNAGLGAMLKSKFQARIPVNKVTKLDPPQLEVKIEDLSNDTQDKILVKEDKNLEKEDKNLEKEDNPSILEEVLTEKGIGLGQKRNRSVYKPQINPNQNTESKNISKKTTSKKTTSKKPRILKENF